MLPIFIEYFCFQKGKPIFACTMESRYRPFKNEKFYKFQNMDENIYIFIYIILK